jgi:hypothetical protein
LTALFTAVADAGATLKRNKLGLAYVNAKDAFEQQAEVKLATVVALRDAAEAYDAALQVDPKKMFTSLSEAHGKLTKALNREDLDFNELWPQLQNIAEEVAKLNAIVQSLEKAATTTTIK